jgi:hypothetical protein
MGLSETAATGDRRATLEELRQTLAAAIEEGVPPRDLASLSRQLTAVLAELEQQPLPKKESKVDDLASKRKQRRAS